MTAKAISPKPATSVLIVDDDFSGRAMLALSLRQEGMTVNIAASGEEALDCLRAQKHDWLLTDGKMEPMDGFELALRAKELQPDLKIAMISALYSAKDAHAYPIDYFLPKPFHVETLISALAV